jgi:O-methyltransferase
MPTPKHDPRRKFATPTSLISEDRLASIFKLAQSVRQLPGYGAEVGVYKGGSARLICEALQPRAVLLADTFTGLPKTTSVDTHCEGDFADTSVELVMQTLAPYVNYVILRGEAPQSFFGHIKVSRQFKFVHLDVDLYGAMLENLKWFYPRMSTGGIIVMDDYLAPTCPGATKAIEEFFADKGEKIKSAAQYQAYIVKGE